MKKLSKRHIAFGHVLLFLVVLAFISPSSLSSSERLVATFVLALLLSYGMAEHIHQSLTLALLAVFIMGLLDPQSIFTECSSYKVEYFDEKKEEKPEKDKKALIPAGEDSKDTSIQKVSEKETRPLDTITLKESDLEDLLSNEGSPKKKETFLPGFDNLLEKAREDAKNNMAPPDVSPAQAQRQTHQIIDTVKQLKDTMISMMPLLKQGKEMMEMYKSLDMQALGLENKKS